MLWVFQFASKHNLLFVVRGNRRFTRQREHGIANQLFPIANRLIIQEQLHLYAMARQPMPLVAHQPRFCIG